MPLLVILAFTLSISSSSVLLKNISNISQKIHNYCLQNLPEASQYPQAHAALLCGENVTDEKTKNLLIRSSLIHLFVVSGSHLLLLEEILIFLNLPLALRLMGEIFYGLACSWQAPIARALLSHLLKINSSKARLHWSSDTLVLVTGLLTLCLFPDWVSSRSLLMSWFAALALAGVRWFSPSLKIFRLLLPFVVIYFAMLPVLWGFGNLHPLSIFFNIFLAPFISLYLLPLSFLNCFFSGLTSLFDQSFHLFLFLCQHFGEPVQVASTSPLSLETLWIMLFAYHFLVSLLRLHQGQRRL